MSEHGYDPDYDPGEDAPELDPEYSEDAEVSPEEEETFQHDLTDMLGFYQEETESYNASKDDFQERYAFVHDCRCAEDWEEGNIGAVSMCYLGLVNDAMETLEAKVKELKLANRENAELRIKLADNC